MQDREHLVHVESVEDNKMSYSTQDGYFSKEFFLLEEKTFVFSSNGATLEFSNKRDKMALGGEQGEGESSKVTFSPMPGTVSKVSVSVGDKVAKGQTLLVVEAMKMEHNIKATQEGVVKSIGTVLGGFVEQGMLLVELE